MKILVATEKPFAAVAVDGIRKAVEESGNEIVLLEKGSKDDLLKTVADVEGLIVRSDIVDTAVLDAGKKLKVIVRAGAGVDNIDLVSALSRPVLDLFPDAPDVVNAIIGRRIDLHHIHIGPGSDIPAHLTFTARASVHRMLAVDRPGKNLGHRSLSGPPGPAEQIGMSDPS